MKIFNSNNNEQGRFRVDVLDDVLHENIKIHSHLIFQFWEPLRSKWEHEPILQFNTKNI